LKSRWPTIDQAGDTAATYVAVGFKIEVPFINQIATSPLVSRQAMSLFASSLKSWVWKVEAPACPQATTN